jgi:hypothetical protein
VGNASEAIQALKLVTFHYKNAKGTPQRSPEDLFGN